MGDLLLDENIEYIEEDNLRDSIYVSDDDYNSNPEEASNIVSGNSINRFDIELVDKSAIEKGGVDLEGESGFLISGGNVIFNVDNVEVSNLKSSTRSAGTFEIDNYDSTNLWNNNKPTNWFDGSIITLDDNINNYDLLAFEIKLNINSDNILTYILTVDDFKNISSTGKNFQISGLTINGTIMFYRTINYNSDTSIKVSDAWNDGGSQQSYNDYNLIPLNIYGLKAEVMSEPTPIPTTVPNEGNTIINNYYGCVSDNSLSYNIMNKPLNQYNTAESFCAFGCLFALGIGLYLLIRKVIFKWQ